MIRKYICAGTKYEVGGPKHDTIGLPVSPSGLPPTIAVEGYTLSLKSSFHVSLVCVGKIKDKHKVLRPDFVEEIIEDFCEYTKNSEINLVRYSGEFRFVSEGDRRSVVAMCEVVNLRSFFDLINKKYNIDVEYPPTHVTIYTLQPDKGIFLCDTSDLKELTKIIEIPININL